MLCGCCEVQVLNGLLERPDWECAIKMPIGIIPAGTFAPAMSPCSWFILSLHACSLENCSLQPFFSNLYVFSFAIVKTLGDWLVCEQVYMIVTIKYLY